MIQITEEKKEKLSEMCGKMLRYAGKMMQCLESLDEEGEEDMGMRDYPEYPDWDGRMGYRDEMGYRGDRMNGDMGMRRGRSSRTGRFMRM